MRKEMRGCSCIIIINDNRNYNCNYNKNIIIINNFFDLIANRKRI